MDPILSFKEIDTLCTRVAFENLNASANGANEQYKEALQNAFNSLKELKKFY